MEVQAEILQTRVKKIIFFAKSKKIVTALLEAEALKDLTWIVVTEGEMNWIDAKQSQNYFFLLFITDQNLRQTCEQKTLFYKIK